MLPPWRRWWNEYILSQRNGENAELFTGLLQEGLSKRRIEGEQSLWWELTPGTTEHYALHHKVGPPPPQWQFRAASACATVNSPEYTLFAGEVVECCPHGGSNVSLIGLSSDGGRISVRGPFKKLGIPRAPLHRESGQAEADSQEEVRATGDGREGQGQGADSLRRRDDLRGAALYGGASYMRYLYYMLPVYGGGVVSFCMRGLATRHVAKPPDIVGEPLDAEDRLVGIVVRLAKEVLVKYETEGREIRQVLHNRDPAATPTKSPKPKPANRRLFFENVGPFSKILFTQSLRQNILPTKPYQIARLIANGRPSSHPVHGPPPPHAHYTRT